MLLKHGCGCITWFGSFVHNYVGLHDVAAVKVGDIGGILEGGESEGDAAGADADDGELAAKMAALQSDFGDDSWDSD